ncbi:MAG: leucine-rich repeat domain-containing protein [Bacteroidales bacterium]|jgi:hypothetical protein|nr:leucine-rich repeat domain-containing protein [Bacteroidales bacterium]
MKKTTLKFKALLLLGLALIFTIPVKAGVTTINTDAAGQLYGKVMAACMGVPGNVTDLVVTGIIDARDFRNIRDNLVNLTSLDLSGCTIAAFSGDGGTSVGWMGPQSDNYGADTVPVNAFYAEWNDWNQTPPQQVKSLPKLTNLVLPDGTKMINNAALRGLSALTELDLSNLTSLERLGNMVLQNDTSLKKVIFPTAASFKEMGQSVFYGCKNMDTINIPKSVESIYLSAGSFFAGCSKLAAVNFEEPASIKILPPLFLAAESFGVVLKDLKYFKLPSSVDSLHSTAMGEAFNGFMGTYIDCDAGNAKYESKNGMLYLKSGQLVAIPKGLTTVTLGSDITVLPTSAFEGMTNITSITIEGALTEIGNHAFYNCPITSFTFPSTLVKIGNFAFQGTKLSTVDFSNTTNLTQLGMSIFSGVKTIKGAVNLSGLNVMGDGMFFGCDSITGFTLSNSLTKLPFQVFASCKALETVTLPNSIDTIGEQAFLNCSNLASITLPTSLKFLSFQSIDGTLITAIDLPENAQLGANLYNGYGLKYIVVNANANSPYYKSEGNALLSKDGTKLIYAANSKVPAHLIIPEGVDTVRDNAFMSLYDSPQTYKVTLPSTLKFVGMNGLTAFNNVDTIISNAVVPPAAFIDQWGGDNVFGNQYGHNVKQIIIPAQTKAYYVAAPGWKYYSAALFTPDMVYATAQNLEAEVAAQYSNDVNLSWEAPVSELDIKHYNIYRNNELLDSVSEATVYTDTAAPLGDVYYQVSVQYVLAESERTDSVMVTVELEPVSNAFVKNAENISLYPNPTSDFITVSADCETVSVYNMQGKLLVRANGNKVDMRSLPNGTYVVEVKAENGKVSTTKVIKK